MNQVDVHHGLTERIENLVRQTDSIADSKTRELVVSLVTAVMELHAAALARIITLARSEHRILDAIATDEFVSAVLALHDLHPHAFEVRLARTIDKLRDQLKSGAMDLRLVEASASRATLRLFGGHPASRAAARHWIQSAVYEAAPEIEEIIVEGTEDPAFVPLESLLVSREAV